MAATVLKHRPREKQELIHQWDTDPTLMGKQFVDRQQRIALTIGHDSWTYREMVTQLQIANFKAAGILSRIARTYKATSVRDLASRASASDMLRERGVGVTTLFVWMVALDVVVGQTAPLRWLDSTDRTIPTLKARATRKDKPRKKRR